MDLEARSRHRFGQYKNNKKNADEMRKKRSEQLAGDRKMRRAEEALLRRNVAELPTMSIKPINIKVKLEKWKSEKLEKERIIKLKARPPFVTGRVKHKIGSPFLYKVEMPVTDRRITRATVAKKKQDQSDGIEKNIVSRNFKFKAPAGIVPIPLNCPSTKGRVVTNNKIQTEKSVKKLTNKDVKTPSECRNYSEVETSISEKRSSLESTSEVVTEAVISLNIADGGVQERDVKSFRVELDSEIATMQTLCKQWSELKDNVNLPEHVNDMVDLTVGQTKLLISKKLAQYRGLIDECEAGSVKVTCSDLQGFWDMVYMQVKDVKSKFEKLESLKDNNWMEVDLKQKPVVKKKKIIPKRQIYNASTSKSSIRGFIAAARNKCTTSASTTPGRQKTPQKRKSDGVKTAFTPKAQSEKENKFKPKTPVEIRRISQVLMKISSQAKEIGTPKSQKKTNTPLVDVGDVKKPRSVTFSGKEVQLNDLDETSETIPKMIQEYDCGSQDTPKRVHSLRRSTRLNK